MKEYQSILMDRYSNSGLDKLDKMLLADMCAIPSANGFGEEMLDWLNEHPNASLQEVARFEGSFLTLLEIVDDGELDEEERNPAVYED